MSQFPSPTKLLTSWKRANRGSRFLTMVGNGRSSTHEDVVRWVVQMRNGDHQARNAIVEAHVYLAFKAAMKYRDDQALFDAFEALVLAVDRFDGPPDRMTAYLHTVVKLAANTHHRDAERHAKRIMEGRIRHEDRVEPCGNVDALEQLMASCETDLECQMVALRVQSYTYQEIAKQLGVSYTTVATSITKVGLRWSMRRKLSA